MFALSLLLGLVLSIDSFAVSLVIRNTTKYSKKLLTLPLLFGLAHTIMILLGYYVFHLFEEYVRFYDHWIAFIVLVFIGVRMIIVHREPPLDKERVFFLAFATSIDALVLGITLDSLGLQPIMTAFIIGLCVLFVSLGAIVFGGVKLKPKTARIMGGVVLILLGLKILFDHL